MKCAVKLISLLLVAGTGCASNDAFASRAVRRSKAYAEMMARSSHATFVTEEKHLNYAIVALGEMPESELKRHYTLRVSSTGAVWRKVPDMHHADAWLPER